MVELQVTPLLGLFGGINFLGLQIPVCCSVYPKYDESAYNFELQSDYLNATNVETFGAAAAGPVDIPLGGIGEDVLDFGGDTIISGADSVDTITFNDPYQVKDDEEGNDTISLG